MVASAGDNVPDESVVGPELKKRRTRSSSTTSTSPTVAADANPSSNGVNAVAAPAIDVAAEVALATDAAAAVVAVEAPAVSVAAPVTKDEEDQLSEDESDAMKEVMAKMKEVSDANSAQFAQSADKRNGNGNNMQLYDSKRMSRVSFNSWFEFDSYFEMYMQDTYQPFRMRSSCSVEAYRRNQQKVMMNNKNSRGRRIEFPDSAIHHHRIYMCTHAMKARCRGASTRPGQKYRGIGCIAKINVKISPSENPSKYMVIVTDQVVTHNHPVSREIYEAYPDVLLKTMRRNQLSATMLTRQPSPKFENSSQTQKYERASQVLNSVAEAMAHLSDVEFELQLSQLQKIYANSLGEQQNTQV